MRKSNGGGEWLECSIYMHRDIMKPITMLK
jgi:hypothetical protein